MEKARRSHSRVILSVSLLLALLILMVTIDHGSCSKENNNHIHSNGRDPYRRFLLSNGLGHTPPMGWNSWNHFGCSVTEKIVREAGEIHCPVCVLF